MNIRIAKLYDSETTKAVTAKDLRISRKEYIEAVRESKNCRQAEGHIKINGRRVYAQ